MVGKEKKVVFIGFGLGERRVCGSVFAGILLYVWMVGKCDGIRGFRICVRSLYNYFSSVFELRYI